MSQFHQPSPPASHSCQLCYHVPDTDWKLQAPLFDSSLSLFMHLITWQTPKTTNSLRFCPFCSPVVLSAPLQYPTHRKCSNKYLLNESSSADFLPASWSPVFCPLQSSCHHSSSGTYLLSINNTLTYPVLAHQFQSIRVQLLLSKLPKIPAHAPSLFKSSLT